VNRITAFIENNCLFLSLLVYQALIAGRIFIEMSYLTPFIFIHQLFWFTGVIVWFFLVFRHLLDTDIRKMWFFSAGALITYIPLIYATLKGEEWSLNYVAPESVFQVIRDMATLLLNHPRNWPMFPELIVLISFTLAIAICLSKNIGKSVLATIISVYGSFLIFGFSWISVDENHPSAILLNSSFEPQKFYALQMIGICSMIILFTVQNEIMMMKKELSIKLSHIGASSMILFIFIMSASTVATSGKTPSVADIAVSFPTAILFGGSLFFAIKTKSLKNFLVPFNFSIFYLITLFYTQGR